MYSLKTLQENPVTFVVMHRVINHIITFLIIFVSSTVSYVSYSLCALLFQIVLDHCIDRAVRDDEERSLTVSDCCVTDSLQSYMSKCRIKYKNLIGLL